MEEHVLRQKIVQTLEDNYMPYAMSVIVSRALPEIDGFKPSHRKLLYTMYKMNLIKGARTKSANIVGQTMKLNPHGDAAIYETMVRLTKGNGALNMPLVDSKGNFGKVYSRDMAYAAARYTEAKLSDVCTEVFSDIEENAVEFMDNYDGTLKEPMLLPTKFPNILVNPNQGIAVGMASNICGFNLREVCDATIAYLNNEEADVLASIIAPDFPTGGSVIYDEAEMRTILQAGKGSFKVRSKYKYFKKENCIEITEIPYTTTVEAIIDKIEELVKAGKIKEISDVRDETDLSGLKLTIDMKRSTDPDVLMERLFKSTPLEDSFSCNFNILINGMPRVMGIKEIIKEWCIFRTDCIVRKYHFLIEKMQKRHHLLLGLKRILLDIDKAIEIVRHTEREKDVVPRLMEHFEISELQADYVAEIKLRHLNKQYILDTLKEVETLEKEMARLQDMIDHPKKIKNVICQELTQIKKKFGRERQTQIIYEAHITRPQTEALIEDYNVKLFFTHHQYLKKITLVSLRSSGEQKLKENDTIIQEMDSNNKHELLLFSNKCNVYKLQLHEIEDTKASQFGIYLPNLLDLEEGEQIVNIVSTVDYSGYMVFGFETGKVAKVPLSAYETKTKRKKLIKAYYGKAECVGMTFATDQDILELVRADGKVAYIMVSKIEEKQKRDSNGVQAITITKKIGLQALTKVEDPSEEALARVGNTLPVMAREPKEK